MKLSKEQQAIINQGLEIIASLYERQDLLVNNPAVVKDYCKLRLGTYEQEVFGALLLDSQHRLVKPLDMFFGSICSASVYPREVVKSCLAYNAAAVVFYHNHPSGNSEESISDVNITERLVDALELIEVRVLDHIVVGGDEATSFAERGLL